MSFSILLIIHNENETGTGNGNIIALQKLHKLKLHPNCFWKQVIHLSLSSPEKELEKLWSLKNAEKASLYISISTQSSHLHDVLGLIQKYMKAATGLRNISFIEDTWNIERHYIYTNEERRFLGTLKELIEGFGASFELTSSNELCNSWGCSDTYLVNISELADKSKLHDLWHVLNEQVNFVPMYNQGNAVPRLVSVQSVSSKLETKIASSIQKEFQLIPHYRHPHDDTNKPKNTEMVPAIKYLMSLVEKHTGIKGLNHCLVQKYRDGNDFIQKHSDKTLDMDEMTPIVNLSLGSSRTMRLRNKECKNAIEEIPLRSGECCVFGLKTNQHWYHEIPKKVNSNNLLNVERISFTFRKINTYAVDSIFLFGRGTPFASLEEAYSALGDSFYLEEKKKYFDRKLLIQAFGQENRLASAYNRKSVYGNGYLLL